MLSLRLEHTIHKRRLINESRNREALLLFRTQRQLTGIDRIEHGRNVDRRTWILLHLVAAAGRRDLRMPERRQTTRQHLLANPCLALWWRHLLELLNKVRHVVNRAEVPRAVEGHLRRGKIGRASCRER